MPVARPLIPLLDYQRIFRVIKTVLEGADANPAYSCIFFSVAGAAILHQFYKKRCVPMAGAAFYAMGGPANDVLTFARLDGEAAISSSDAFHCWIQCDDYIIDFMAPVFRESLKAIGHDENYSRKMFQKSLKTMAPSHNHLYQSGDFYLQPNIDLTRETLQRFFARNDTQDLVNICAHWYKKPPKDIPRQLSMADNYGVTMNMILSELTVVGAW